MTTAITHPLRGAARRAAQAPTVARRLSLPSTRVTLEQGLDDYLASLDAKNRSAATIRAYRTDLTLFISWLHENNVAATYADRVERADITEYLVHLGNNGLTGVSRARKLAAIREYFRFLEADGYVVKSPASAVETPKKERGRGLPPPRRVSRHAGAGRRQPSRLRHPSGLPSNRGPRL